MLSRLLTTTLVGLAGLAGLASSASLKQVTSFGSNPSNTKMYIYVPDKVASKPPIIVAIHYCSGTASAYYAGTPYAQLAEKYGFIVIYPESPYSGTCWDVSSQSALLHNGGGDSNSIANMVTYTINTYGADANRVYVTGSSSGAMMTNVMAAAYPSMFKAGIVYSGVPAACFQSASNGVAAWNSTCSQGQSIHTQTEWANTVFAMYPGYSGNRPRMQIYHGSADTTLYPQNWNETIKQWTGVFGYSATAQQTLAGSPSRAYTKYIYGPKVQGIYGTGIGHGVPVMGAEDMKWFCLDGSCQEGYDNTGGSGTTTTTRVTSTTTSSAPTTTTNTGGSAQQWGQCGGIGWTGPTSCVSPYTCTYVNNWYSQCL